MNTWQIILAIVIVGLSIVMPIYYSSEKKKNEVIFKFIANKEVFDGAPARIRTADLLITNRESKFKKINTINVN